MPAQKGDFVILQNGRILEVKAVAATGVTFHTGEVSSDSAPMNFESLGISIGKQEKFWDFLDICAFILTILSVARKKIAEAKDFSSRIADLLSQLEAAVASNNAPEIERLKLLLRTLIANFEVLRTQIDALVSEFEAQNSKLVGAASGDPNPSAKIVVSRIQENAEEVVLESQYLRTQNFVIPGEEPVLTDVLPPRINL